MLFDNEKFSIYNSRVFFLLEGLVMKKIICFLLSAMLFLLPVLSQAESFLDKVSELVDQYLRLAVTLKSL